jgi:hypothetical protein
VNAQRIGQIVSKTNDQKPATTVDRDISAAPKPTINPTLVTIAETAPKLTKGSRNTIIAVVSLSGSAA